MLRDATETRFFQVRREEAQNPYIGIMSFQHFRGERMYSDIVVRPEANMTETERVECYPPSPDAEENGREEGYYPDTTIVYIRVLWKEFEPERGVYRYEFIDEIIRQAKQHGQSLIFRLMGHSTRACDDVPEWLKGLIDCPARPDGMRVKDSPTDPLFIDLFLEAVKKFAARYDAEPTLEAMDISLPGAWGEGHKLFSFPENTFERIMATYAAAFRHTRLLGQAAKPQMIHYPASMPIGWRGDGFGEPQHMEQIYPRYIDQIKDIWKVAPVSFESYWWLCEWKRRGWDVDQIIEQSLAWHVSSFNPKSMPIPFEWKDKIDRWIDRMGYHFSIVSAATPAMAAPGDTAELILCIRNIGVAPIYKEIPLLVRLVGGERQITHVTDVDIRRWMPGESTVRAELPIPDALPSGEYAVEIGIMSEEVPLLYFATDAERCGSFYRIGSLSVRSAGN